MAGSLIKIDEEIVSSAVASVTLTGIDSTYDVYMVKASGIVVPASSTGDLRVTTSGTPDTSANYDYAYKGLRSDTTFTNFSNTNQTSFTTVFQWSTYTTSGMTGNGIVYLFNFNNASEYSFITNESVTQWQNGVLGMQGGGVHTVAQACDGIQWLGTGGNTTAGTFTLYGLKK